MSSIDYDQVRADIRALADEVIRPNAEKNDAESIFPRENLNALAKAGWNGILLPKEYGGLGLDHVAFSIVAEEIGRADASTGLVYVMHTGAAQTINLFGNEEQKRRWLAPARNGLLGTYSTSEKASGGHWWFNLSEASRNGDDGYLLNAEKSFTTSAGKADYYIFQTRSPGAKSATDISFFIVDSKLDGITAGRWEALGVRGNHSGPLSFKNVAVHAHDHLGEEGKGKDIIYHGVSPIYLIGLGSVWHGVARAALERATEHLTGTIHRDFNKKLSDYQVLRQQLGESKVLVESLRPWQHELARQLDQLQAANQPQGQILIPLTEFKVHASEVANISARNALDVSGGYGYKKGPLERIFRDARAGIGMGPSNNIAREWIGKVLVGLPLELFEEGGE
ncbi:acyl-CoA dehydrogenase [Candidatus Methylospira mobilis]|uniref:Acyl-CoA dehydrogenase n=1 Tax=Candidatus Methylospira mobilis TaxID=1808979 RepID=A0A5Q0BJA5_9GAMM|nr:acyl-CoA dehydrogenase family protein [Candidatus Methylospira mobilis]QFY43212.1 acyl-CoA dehydrogenase [Candidatus Methylospira mobilis]WNV03583.1 acyl-CoA dehydrogenase family protein [Candidatus Methylospira mobilis]